MNYEFNKLNGHFLQRKYLANSIAKGKVANSYLFYGKEGVGKKLVALEFASILNCPVFNSGNNGNFNPDCECLSCRKIRNGVHPDVSIILSSGLREIKVDQIRERIEELLYLKPYEGLYKVALVDNAELMNSNAQNSFLKTLEEPPSNSVIILISSRPQYLLPTIVSRCQRVEYFSLPEGIIREFLNNADYTDNELEQAVMLSRGSLGKASMLNRGFLEQRKIIIKELSDLKISHGMEISNFADSFSRDKSSENTDKINLLFETLFLWLQDILLLKNGFEKEELLDKELYDITNKMASVWSFDKLFATGKFLEEAWRAVFYTNVNKQYVLENLALEFAEQSDM